MKRILCFAVAVLAVAVASLAAEPFTLTQGVTIFRTPLFALAPVQVQVIQRPLSAFGLTAGVCYGTTVPTLANTGTNIADGELCVILTAGSAPVFQIYDDSTASWRPIGASGSGGTNNTIPVWDATGQLEDSVLDDVSGQMIITGSASQLSIPSGTLGDPAIVFTDDDDGTGTGIFRLGINDFALVTNGVIALRVISNQQILGPGGTASSPQYTFALDLNTGFYRPGADALGISAGGALVFDIENTNAAGASANLATVSSTLGIMNGADTVNGLSVELTSVDHTGVGNVIAAATIAAIAGDAQARETGLDVLGGFDVGITSIAPIFDRQDFNEPVFEIQDDFTAKSLTDGEVNLAMGHGGILFEYRNEQTQTTSPVIFTATSGLDISGDDGATGNEGVEIYLGASQNTTTGYLVAQTDQLCFSVNVTVALIAGTDQLVIGWRANAAYDAANVYTNYGDYAVVGINNIDGSVFGLSDSTTGAAETDDSTTDWANGETKTLKQCIDGAGLVHAYLDGTLVAETNRTTAIDSGIVMNPFISYLDVAATAANPVINWWEITAN